MKKYKLTTIKDIFDKVPVDRLDDLFAEIKQLMVQCDMVRNDESVSAVEFPSFLIWIDDGKKEIVVQLHSMETNNHIGTIKTIMGDK